MKDYKTEDVILGVGTVLIFIVILAALFSFTDWGEEPNNIPTIRWQGAQGAGNPQTAGTNPNRNMGITQNALPSGFVNVAAPQNPAQMGGNGQMARQGRMSRTGSRFLAQQTRVNKELIKTIMLSEAHWQGMELLPLSSELKQKLKIPMNLSGVLVDEVTLNALLSGIRGGDVVLEVKERPVGSLEEFQMATMRIRNKKKAKLKVWRKGKIIKFKVRADNILGLAQVETAPMILAGAMRPHPYRGPCTQCHLIGDTATLKPDPDGVILPPPVISAGARMPHRDRGPCKACHVIVQ
jgi:hypothetical protein